jgi:hypothetical protein
MGYSIFMKIASLTYCAVKGGLLNDLRTRKSPITSNYVAILLDSSPVSAQSQGDVFIHGWSSIVVKETESYPLKEKSIMMRPMQKIVTFIYLILLQSCVTPRKPADPCIENGKSYNVGDKVMRECNECICQEKGGWLCTVMGCGENPEN